MGDGWKFSLAIAVLAYGVGDEVMAAFTDSYQVMLYTLLSEALVAIGAVMHLQWVARAVLITQAALVAVQRKAGVALGLPGSGGDVLLVSRALHRFLCPAGVLAKPCLVLPSPIAPEQAGPCPAKPRLTEPCRALQLVAAARRWFLAMPRLAPPRRTASRPAMPYQAIANLAKPRRASQETQKPTCLPTSHLLKVASVSTDKQAFTCDVCDLWRGGSLSRSADDARQNSRTGYREATSSHPATSKNGRTTFSTVQYTASLFPCQEGVF